MRCGSSCRKTRVICGRVIWGSFFPPVQLQTQQEGSGQQGHGDVMMPAQPSAHFVLVETGFAFLGLKLGLDGPAHGPDLCQPQQGRVSGRIRQVVLGFAAIQIAPQDQQPAGPPRQTVPAFPDPQGRKLMDARPLRALRHRQCRATRRAARLAATACTLWGPGSPATSWGWVGLRPRPDQAGTATWAACVKTCVVLGTSST